MVGTSYNGTLPNQVATTGVEGLQDDHPRLGDLLLVRLLPGQRPRRRAPLRGERRGRERLPGRGHRRARRLHRRSAHGGPGRQVPLRCTTSCSDAQDRVTGDYSPFWAARDYLGKVEPHPCERVRRPRPQRLQRQDEGVRRVVVPARQAARGAQDLAAQRRSRRPPGRRRGRPTRSCRTAGSTTTCSACANGIEREPRATVQREDGAYTQEARLARAGHRARDARAGRDARSTAPGTLTRVPAAARRPQPFTDSGRRARHG